ncbi:hypothetical protein VTL71DRAFT_14727 [Oculimacula yallundae]|uniref:Uncharacterized protein n=1 Tax=Oculimacula yallundae TaxID=86028 RepID=A0ABR4CJZ5_9HELO
MVFHHFPNHFIDPDASSSTTASPVYSHSPSSPLPYLPILPSRTTSSTHSPATTPTLPLPTLTGPFPPLLPAPSGLQIRVRDQDAVFASLDQALIQKAQNAFSEDEDEGEDAGGGGGEDEWNGKGVAPMQDEARMVAKGRYEAMETEDELRPEMAQRALEEFTRERIPYVVCASERLQAVFGDKNSMGFELPEVPRNMTPSFGRILSTPPGPSNNLSPGFSPRNTSFNDPADRRKDSGVYMQQRSPLSPISPFGFHQVDEKTGEGLREWLLKRGKETGTQRKREPTTYTDPTSNLPAQGIQTWLWFLISRPVISLSPTETNTNPLSAWTHNPKPPTTIRPPPDFQMPIPTSYVVFACPASNITEYPDCKDDSAPPPPSTIHSRSHVPGAPAYFTSQAQTLPHLDTRSSSSSSEVKKIYKRKDYDFSFQGIPLFEFSSSALFSVPSRSDFSILSIENIGSWYPSDESGFCTIDEWQSRIRAWEDEIDNLGREERKVEERAYRERGSEDPSAKRGVWWARFYEGVYAEERRWRRIKECMSRGKCRVVVRWVELESTPPMSSLGSGFGPALRGKKNKTSPLMDLGDEFGEGDADMNDFDDAAINLGLGIDIDHGRTRRGSGENKKFKERIARRRLSSGAQAKVTRSEARRRSGLGVFSTSQETVVGAGVLIGIGGENGVAAEGGGEDEGAPKEKRRKK